MKNVGSAKKSKYEIGDMLYSYQNKNYKAPIEYKKFVPWESLLKPNKKDKFVYKLKLQEGYSNWIDEKSLYNSAIGSLKNKQNENHKDTKSHNVNIRVVSGVDMYKIRDMIENEIKNNLKLLDIFKTYQFKNSTEKKSAIKKVKSNILLQKKQLKEQNKLINQNLK
jgi:hypothetical protein